MLIIFHGVTTHLCKHCKVAPDSMTCGFDSLPTQCVLHRIGLFNIRWYSPYLEYDWLVGYLFHVDGHHSRLHTHQLKDAGENVMFWRRNAAKADSQMSLIIAGVGCG